MQLKFCLIACTISALSIVFTGHSASPGEQVTNRSGTYASAFADSFPPNVVDYTDEVPSICQSCYPETVEWAGKPHCAPAAVSNSLVWLSKNGYPSLQPFLDKDPLVAQARLVNRLGQIMGTSENAGTSPAKVLTGLKKYFDQTGTKYSRIASAGWRDVPTFVARDKQVADLEWIKEGFRRKSSIWILIGWSKYDSYADNYRIYDGHWMTVVGFGKNAWGKDDPNILILKDPAGRSERRSYYATVTPLQRGSINGKVSAAGNLSLSGDIVLKPSADFGIIQGAYRIEL